MAETWVARSAAIAHASGKSMLDVFNGGASVKIVRTYLLYQFNTGIAAVVGVLSGFALRKTTASSAGSAVTPVALDSNSAALDANTTAGTGRTITPGSTLRSFIFSNEEPTTTGAGLNNLELLVPYAEWGRYGVDSATLEPNVSRATQGIDIAQTGTSAVNTADCEIHFTST